MLDVSVTATVSIESLHTFTGVPEAKVSAGENVTVSAHALRPNLEPSSSMRLPDAALAILKVVASTSGVVLRTVHTIAGGDMTPLTATTAVRAPAWELFNPLMLIKNEDEEKEVADTVVNNGATVNGVSGASGQPAALHSTPRKQPMVYGARPGVMW
jgi:hypothetical protein